MTGRRAMSSPTTRMPIRLGLKGLPEAVTANWPKARSDRAGRYSSSNDSQGHLGHAVTPKGGKEPGRTLLNW